MTPEHWQRIKALLEAALQHEPTERADFLDRACRGDESLRQQVDSFLNSYEKSGSFIEEPAFGLMAESLASDPIEFGFGSKLGHYTVLKKLGAGGMGEVYLAEDTRLGRKIAVKILPSAFVKDGERVHRFQQEARAASALNHPNILTIHEIGQADSSHFIATEFIEGETLRQHMMTAPVKLSDALEIAIQVASALCAAHEAGIVHRDIKPENIMLRQDGIVKVLDFGLAKLTETKAVSSDSPTLFQTIEGMVMGTAYYMSPEQARGLVIDARTDIWSLGVVVYEMIGGRLPFEGATSSDVIAAILDREPASLLKYSPETPKELEWILKKALRKDRDERYQTARELLSDLKNLKERLAFEAELARSAAPEEVKLSAATGPESRDTAPQIARLSTLTLAQKWHGRREIKILFVLAVGLALAVAGYFWLRPKQNHGRSQGIGNFSFTHLLINQGLNSSLHSRLMARLSFMPAALRATGTFFCNEWAEVIRSI